MRHTYLSNLLSSYVLASCALSGGAMISGHAEARAADRTHCLPQSRPHATLIQDFERVSTNRPVALRGWHNLAHKGRAWWGYELYDDNCDNHAAKITAYGLSSGGNAPDDIDAMLVTPPLSLNKAPARKLYFRFMGTDLRPEMAGCFEICCIENEKGKARITPLPVEIDFSPEADNIWQHFVVDFSDADISDVFFVGFRLRDTADTDYSGVFFIDDVSWGHDTYPGLCPTSDVARITVPHHDGMQELCYVTLHP